MGMHFTLAEVIFWDPTNLEMWYVSTSFSYTVCSLKVVLQIIPFLRSGLEKVDMNQVSISQKNNNIIIISHNGVVTL